MQITKHIPNTITSMNLISGSIGVIFCLSGDVRTAFVLMIASAVFDFFDGFAARMLGAYSEIGKELDSLADVISFGLLPAMMLHETMVLSRTSVEVGYAGMGAGLVTTGTWISWLPLILAAFSALRLAKFNLDERQHDSFIGLPTPAAAMICGSLAYYVASVAATPAFASAEMSVRSGNWLTDLCSSVWFLPALAFSLSLLLVSEIPMFSMKFGKGKQADKGTMIVRFVFLGIVAVSALAVLAFGANWSLIPLISFTGYILLNVACSFRPGR